MEGMRLIRHNTEHPDMVFHEKQGQSTAEIRKLIN